ncbi:HNH endonuclease [Microbacterium sp. EYE_5]|uniref:HNH endonuclease n=1 Tax=unclassified Microbacterium TaxID=2609290 RepID=UPI0020048FFF|nr:MULTISPECIES: HNH endonuclease signature motif containing protein [unclassified Microbacterium]MCK6123928.1 HNH endonuclease [Microbacterium sp. EYE_80]MCK6126837.1 HNH endonuclease [Microbacterium sp. EYE_79]MCK6218483.1 HNH endonuclease [Microbacterium sp. EYE_5]MCK6247343.1 HNH endonuclease [Microbacterium sp. EYE_78]
MNHRFEEAVAPLPPISFSFEVRLDSKPKFDAFDLGRRFREEVLEREQAIVEQMDVRRQVLRHHLDYEARVGAEALPRLGRSERADVAKTRFDAVEERLFTETLLERPTPQARIVGVARYTSPQGRNSYEKSHAWGFDDLRQELGLAREDRDRRSTTQFLRDRERSLLTPKMRIDVLQRDGRRCRACGATADDATLHIDHIIPVSRGGLTEMSNLQVLCQSCNLGKSNRFVG